MRIFCLRSARRLVLSSVRLRNCNHRQTCEPRNQNLFIHCFSLCATGSCEHSTRWGSRVSSRPHQTDIEMLGAWDGTSKLPKCRDAPHVPAWSLPRAMLIVGWTLLSDSFDSWRIDHRQRVPHPSRVLCGRVGTLISTRRLPFLSQSKSPPCLAK